MRLAIVAPYLNQTGGREKVILAILNEALAAHDDLEVHVFSGRVDGALVDALSERVVFHRVPMLSGNPFLEAVSFFVSSYAVLRKTRFDCYHFHWPFLAAPGPSVYTVHGVHPVAIREIERRNGLVGKLRALVRHLYPNPTPLEWATLRLFPAKKHFVAVSPLVVGWLEEAYGVPSRAVEMIPNPVELPALGPGATPQDEVRRALGVGGDAILLGSVANRLNGKNIDAILRSMVELNDPRLHFLLVGRLRPVERRRLARWVGRWGLHERVHLREAREEIAELYNAMDVFLFPSSYESFGLAFLEALHLGVPCIVSQKVGALPLIPDDAIGSLVFPIDEIDVPSVAEALRTVLQSRPAIDGAKVDALREYLVEMSRESRRRYIRLYRRMAPDYASRLA